MEKGIQTPLEDYVPIYERPNRKCSKFTYGEKAERARISTISYHYTNFEKERERTRLDYHNTNIV